MFLDSSEWHTILTFRTPGSVPLFGTCLCSNCWDQIPRTCHVFIRLFILNAPWDFLDFALENVKLKMHHLSWYRLCAISKFSSFNYFQQCIKYKYKTVVKRRFTCIPTWYKKRVHVLCCIYVSDVEVICRENGIERECTDIDFKMNKYISSLLCPSTDSRRYFNSSKIKFKTYRHTQQSSNILTNS